MEFPKKNRFLIKKTSKSSVRRNTQSMRIFCRNAFLILYRHLYDEL